MWVFRIPTERRLNCLQKHLFIFKGKKGETDYAVSCPLLYANEYKSTTSNYFDIPVLTPFLYYPEPLTQSKTRWSKENHIINTLSAQVAHEN